ncbi:AraC family transcriptional regulator [Maribellus luteus]|uniref:AraC family transcriptional regulator n=1 Tax=Maribellus luteus TaxID=2305463 RepID=A0A399STS1_9BACT|nr:AraC family transcriptional regulator [Maribellus luteus]RIJ45932.1 AraC family transcriptional regulator [Maribellus luteus]
MAVDSFECRIITGGFNRCNSSWNKTSDELDKCFKIYHPVNGNATVTIDGQEYSIKSGNVYFLSGYNIVSQKCTSSMDIYWLHFVPVSLHLKHILQNATPIYARSADDYPFTSTFDQSVLKLFRSTHYLSANTSSLPYSTEEAQLHSYILAVIAELIKDIPAEQLSVSGSFTRLSPSIKFMNDEFRNNPPLHVIASKSNLAPNYFHRVFTQNFGLTPYNYMLKLRMEHAIKQLCSTNKSVKEIAFECGYSNEFYFHRQFKKHYNYSPGKLKRIRPF